MSAEQRIDDVIEAGWSVIDGDFDEFAFQAWRRRAFECLTAVVSPDHAYTRHFAKFVRRGGKPNLLAASGIPSEVQQGLSRDECESASIGCAPEDEAA